jgi:hypothetical protein
MLLILLTLVRINYFDAFLLILYNVNKIVLIIKNKK